MFVIVYMMTMYSNFQLKPSVRGIFSSVLTGLATFDALFLMGAIVTFGMPHLSRVYQVSHTCQGFTRLVTTLKCLPGQPHKGLPGQSHLSRVYQISHTCQGFTRLVTPIKGLPGQSHLSKVYQYSFICEGLPEHQYKSLAYQAIHNFKG